MLNNKFEDIQNEALYNEVQQNKKDIKDRIHPVLDNFLKLLQQLYVDATYMYELNVMEPSNLIFNTYVLAYNWKGAIYVASNMNSNIIIRFDITSVNDITEVNKWIPIIHNCYLKTGNGSFIDDTTVEDLTFKLSANGLELKSKNTIPANSNLQAIIELSCPIETLIYARTLPIGYCTSLHAQARHELSSSFLNLPVVKVHNCLRANDTSISVNFINTQPILKSDNWILLFNRKDIVCAEYIEETNENYDILATYNGIFVKFKVDIPKYSKCTLTLNSTPKFLVSCNILLYNGIEVRNLLRSVIK